MCVCVSAAIGDAAAVALSHEWAIVEKWFYWILVQREKISDNA